MSPAPENVRRLVAALFGVLGNMQKARKNIPDAASLAVLQVIAGAERDGRQIRPSEIADALDVHRSAVTHQIKALTEAGHMTVAPDPGDGRASLLSLTESGRETVGRLARQGFERFSMFVADWSDDDVLQLADLLEKFLASADAVTAVKPPPGAPADWKDRS
jgi:DNA-binding MarR family transcriptional regulator